MTGARGAHFGLTGWTRAGAGPLSLSRQQHSSSGTPTTAWSQGTFRLSAPPSLSRHLRVCVVLTWSQEGKAFLAENKLKEGVIETPSGLQYKVLKSGKEGGKTPLVSTKCLCHYRGEA